MIFHQSHQLQTLYPNPIVIIHGLQHLNLGVIFVHRPVALHLPLNAQLICKHQLAFVLALSYLHHHPFQTAYQLPSELGHMEFLTPQKFRHRNSLHPTKFHESCEGNHQIVRLG